MVPVFHQNNNTETEYTQKITNQPAVVLKQLYTNAQLVHMEEWPRWIWQRVYWNGKKGII